MCALVADGVGRTDTMKRWPVSAHKDQATATQLHVDYVEQTVIRALRLSLREGQTASKRR